jgi:hypothetical protein
MLDVCFHGFFINIGHRVREPLRKRAIGDCRLTDFHNMPVPDDDPASAHRFNDMFILISV